MTLIIGIKCSNGIVVGADGAATLGDVTGLKTVLQPVAKLSVIRDEVIVGLSGPIGLSQLYCDGVNEAWDTLRNERGPEVCRKLRVCFLKDAEITLRVAVLAQQVMGATARGDILHHTLIALATRGSPHLIQFDYQCAPEMATDDLPFVAIGSGQSIADPFLAFLRKVFWKDRLPSLSDGMFAIMWTLRHAIETAPGGIAGPIQMATLEITGGQPLAKILTPQDLREHNEMIDAAETNLKEFRQAQIPTTTESEPPSPPPHPSEKLP